MLVVADVHGAADRLRRVARVGEPLLVLGDLINFIDYRTMDGILARVHGHRFVSEVVALRAAGRYEEARRRWRRAAGGREREVLGRIEELVAAEYREVCAALDGARAFVTFGNVDWPEVLAASLPRGARFVDGEVVEIEGLRVGFAGGGAPTPLGVRGEIGEEEMEEKLSALGAEVDLLCTHAPPDLGPLRRDVVAGRWESGFRAISDYLQRAQPAFHYFGDVHQPQATRWRVGRTVCINVGYFRATGRAVRHE